MRFARRLSLVFILLLALLSASVLLSACSDDEGTPTTQTENGSGNGSSDGSTNGSSNGAPPEVPTKPGLYEQEDGTVQAVGILTEREEEGGYWAVVRTMDPAQAAGADVVAVLGPGELIPAPIDSYRDKPVSVTGTPRDNDIYQAGQFLELTSIKSLAAPTN